MLRSEGVTVLEKWFSMELADVFKDLESREPGLTESEVKQRLEKFAQINRYILPSAIHCWYRAQEKKSISLL